MNKTVTILTLLLISITNIHFELLAQSEIRYSQKWEFEGIVRGSIDLGDINNDGVNDFAIILFENHISEPYSNSVKVFLGGSGQLIPLDLNILPTYGSNDNEVKYEIRNVISGHFNADNWIDLVVNFDRIGSNKYGDFNVEIFWGDQITPFKKSTVIDINDFADFEINNGWSEVENLGDLNNDGIDDLGILPRGFNSGLRIDSLPANEAWIFYGSNVISKSPDSKISFGGIYNSSFGHDLRPRKITNLCDINNDGVNDFAITLSHTTRWGGEFPTPWEGGVLVYFGKDDATNYSNFDLYLGPAMENVGYQDEFGKLLTGCIDVNNDGNNDIIASSDIFGYPDNPENLENYNVFYGGSEIDSVLDNTFSLDVELFGDDPDTLWFDDKISTFNGAIDIYIPSKDKEPSYILFSTFHPNLMWGNANAVAISSNSLLSENQNPIKLVSEDSLFHLGFSHEYSLAFNDFTGDGKPDAILAQTKIIQQDVNPWDIKSTVYMFELGLVQTSNEVIHSEQTDFELYQNFPNPFNPSTKISFYLNTPEKIELKVYDVLGRKLKTLFNNTLSAGNHTFDFNAADLPSGIYFYSLETSSGTEFKKMTLIK